MRDECLSTRLPWSGMIAGGITPDGQYATTASHISTPAATRVCRRHRRSRPIDADDTARIVIIARWHASHRAGCGSSRPADCRRSRCGAADGRRSAALRRPRSEPSLLTTVSPLRFRSSPAASAPVARAVSRQGLRRSERATVASRSRDLCPGGRDVGLRAARMFRTSGSSTFAWGR